MTPPALPLPTPTADVPKVPAPAPTNALPALPDFPAPTAAPDSKVAKPVDITPISGALPQLPDVPAPTTGVKPVASKPETPSAPPKPSPAAPTSDLLPPPPAPTTGKPTPPSAAPAAPTGLDFGPGPMVPPPGKPTATPPAPTGAPPALPVELDPLLTKPAAPPMAAPVADVGPGATKVVAAPKYRILLRVGEGEPTFEVKCGDDLVLKVACEKVDIKSPEKGAGLSAVTAKGKVRFAGFGAEGTCDELSFMAGTGEVSMSGEVKVQVKDKLGRVESELTTASMKYKIDASAVGNALKP